MSEAPYERKLPEHLLEALSDLSRKLLGDTPSSVEPTTFSFPDNLYQIGALSTADESANYQHPPSQYTTHDNWQSETPVYHRERTPNSLIYLPTQEPPLRIKPHPNKAPQFLAAEEPEPAPEKPHYTGEYEAAEQGLKSRFETLVAQLRLEDLLQLEPGRKAPPKNLGDYALIALTAKGDLNSESSTGYHDWETAAEVHYNYGINNGRPYLDSGAAIALVYRGTVSAIGGAKITPEGHLQIVQLQGVNKDASDPQKKYKTGLHGGFYWRDTLVEAWASIARSLDVSVVEIQAAVNSKWSSPTRDTALREGYDTVAARMGFIADPDTHNWQRFLEPPLDPEIK
jgi:hypothetical protein